MTEVHIIIKDPSENVSVSSGKAEARSSGPAPESIELIESQAMRSETEGPPPTMFESGVGGDGGQSSEPPEPEKIEGAKSSSKKKK